MLDRALVAVTSDHGEGLGDHGEQEHGFFLYREARARAAAAAPARRRARGHARHGRRRPRWTSPATLLELAGLPADGMDGALAARRDRRAAGRPARRVYSETLFPRYHFGWSELLAVTDDRYRFIRAPRPELYDLRADPAERQRPAAQPAAAAVAR